MTAEQLGRARELANLDEEKQLVGRIGAGLDAYRKGWEARGAPGPDGGAAADGSEQHRKLVTRTPPPRGTRPHAILPAPGAAVVFDGAPPPQAVTTRRAVVRAGRKRRTGRVMRGG